MPKQLSPADIEQFRRDGMLPATYEVIYGRLDKPRG